MRIQRYIEIFEKESDESFCTEFKISEQDFEKIKSFFTPLEDDPNYWRPYEVSRTAYDALIGIIEDLKKYSFDSYHFYSEAVSV